MASGVRARAVAAARAAERAAGHHRHPSRRSHRNRPRAVDRSPRGFSHPVHVRAHRGAADAAVARDDSHRAAAAGARRPRERRRRARRHPSHPGTAAEERGLRHRRVRRRVRARSPLRAGPGVRCLRRPDPARSQRHRASRSRTPGVGRRRSRARVAGRGRQSNDRPTASAIRQSAIRNPPSSCGSTSTIPTLPTTRQRSSCRPAGRRTTAKSHTPTRSWHASSTRSARVS